MSYPTPTKVMWSKVTNMVEELLMILLILFESPHERGRGVQYLGWNISGRHILICFICLYFYFWSQIFDHVRLSWSTPILYIQISVIIVNHKIIWLIIIIKNTYVNQSLPPLNHFGVSTHNLVENINLCNLFKVTRKNEIQNIPLCPQIFTIRIIRNELINNRKYIFSSYFYRLLPHR